jgi:hypothetical protein
MIPSLLPASTRKRGPEGGSAYKDNNIIIIIIIILLSLSLCLSVSHSRKATNHKLKRSHSLGLRICRSLLQTKDMLQHYKGRERESARARAGVKRTGSADRQEPNSGAS